MSLSSSVAIHHRPLPASPDAVRLWRQARLNPPSATAHSGRPAWNLAPRSGNASQMPNLAYRTERRASGDEHVRRDGGSSPAFVAACA